MHERNQVETWRNLRFLRPGRLVLAAAGIEVVGIASSVISGDPTHYQAFAPAVIAANTGLAVFDTVVNEHSKYLGGIFRKPEETKDI